MESLFGPHQNKGTRTESYTKSRKKKNKLYKIFSFKKIFY